jgi:hypothetical protein
MQILDSPQTTPPMTLSAIQSQVQLPINGTLVRKKRNYTNYNCFYSFEAVLVLDAYRQTKGRQENFGPLF